MALIEVKGLTKAFRTYKKVPGMAGALRGLFHRKYEQTVAVKDVNFTIEEGELVGFLGPNGAGKTTTLKMLAGLLYPSEGSACVLGYVPWERKDGYRRQFALLLGQKNQLWWDLPARESLELNARIYGIDRVQFEKRVSMMTELLKVSDKLNVMVRELSLGERMKFELITSLLHEPKVLFLDEPTIGLDVISQKTVREFLREYNARHKTTILLTSHYMADIQQLCRRVIIIDRGTIFFDGLLSEVLDRFADFKIITLDCEKNGSALDFDPAAFGEVLENAHGIIKIKVNRNQVIPTCKALLDRLQIKDIDIEEVPIEEIIRKVFSRSDETRESASTNNPRAATL